MTKSAKSLVLLAFAASVCGNLFGQGLMDNPAYGTNAIERQKNAILLGMFNQEYHQGGDQDRALAIFYELAASAPAISRNMYIYSAAAYKDKLARAATEQERAVLVDSLMNVYDMRAAAFAHLPADSGAGYILSLKARDFYAFMPDDAMRAMEYFDRAVESWGADADPEFIHIYIKALADYYDRDEIDWEMFVIQTTDLLPIVETMDAAAQERFDGIVLAVSRPGDDNEAMSRAMRCELVETLFASRLAREPMDTLLWERALDAMADAGCRSDFYLTTAERFYAVRPSVALALSIAAAFESMEDYAAAIKYLNAAAGLESESTRRASVLGRLAETRLVKKDYRAAEEDAKRAIAADPNGGYGYFVLAWVYSAADIFCGGFEEKKLMCLIYNLLDRAHELMTQAGDADAAEMVRRSQGKVAAHLPTSEECFFERMKEGDTVNVDCGWIKGKTTLRVRK